MLRKKPNDKKVDMEKLNEILFLSSKILNVAYILIVIIGIYALTLIFKAWNIFPIILNFLVLLAPLFIGFAIAWLLDPLADYLNKKGIKRTYGTLIIIVSFVCIVALFLSAFIPLMKEQIDEFVTLIPSLIETLTNWATGFFAGVDSNNATAIQDSITESLNNFGNELTSDLPNATISFVSSFVSGLGTFLIGLIIGFYLLLHFDKVNGQVERSLPVNYREIYKNLATEMNTSLRNFVSGTLFTSLIVFVACFIGFAIVGLKSPLLFAMICGITNLIPYIGPYIGGFPAAVVGFTISPTLGILTVLVVAIVQALEGFLIHPMIMSKATKLHPVTIIIGLTIFGHFFGIVGMLLATPIIAVLKITLRFINNQFELFEF